jgi:transposase
MAGLGSTARVKDVAAGDLSALAAEIAAAKRRFGLPQDAPVATCYEAGRDGFWIERALQARGIENHVVDSASIEVNRRKRRAKNDDRDGLSLVRQLVRFRLGERDVWKVVRPPSVEQEDARHLHRELAVVQGERRAAANRIESLLVTHGVKLRVNKKFLQRLETARQFDGAPLPPGLVGRIGREFERWRLADRQLSEVKRELKAQARQEAEREPAVQGLLSLRGVGPLGAWILLREGLVWRRFKNRRQAGAFVGLNPTPYDSGKSKREQGIGKAGNARLRTLLVELAWSWLRYQPESALTKWFYERFAKAGGRSRKLGIVALARKLLVALWRAAAFGEVPLGATAVDWETKFGRKPPAAA